MMYSLTIVFAFAAFSLCRAAQINVFQPPLLDLTADDRSTLDAETLNTIDRAIQFEQGNWANGSIYDDPFYTAIPSDLINSPPGTLLAFESDTNTSLYTLPPSTSLARILFQSEDLNGTTVPASAYILIPYRPRKHIPLAARTAFNNGEPSVNATSRWPLVAFAHGTSGTFPSCAPTHIRNLWYQFTVPFTLALAGYVVVAPDYAGLGPRTRRNTPDGNEVPVLHHNAGYPAHANDLFFAVEAAQKAVPELAEEFVVAGHSEGGGAAWGAAQRQAVRPVEGYLGAVAGSPVTNVTAGIDAYGETVGALGAMFANFMPSLYPGFDAKTILTDEGLERQRLLVGVEGCQSVMLAMGLMSNASYYQPRWEYSGWVREYVKWAGNGGKRIGGPLLVLQGDGDMAIAENVTAQEVDNTCDAFPESRLEYSVYAGQSHSATMFAAQQEWLQWIDDRFNGVSVGCGCKKNMYGGVRDEALVQKDLNWYLSYAKEVFEVA